MKRAQVVEYFNNRSEAEKYGDLLMSKEYAYDVVRVEATDRGYRVLAEDHNENANDASTPNL